MILYFWVNYLAPLLSHYVWNSTVYLRGLIRLSDILF